MNNKHIIPNFVLDRRAFLKKAVAGTSGLALGSMALKAQAQTSEPNYRKMRKVLYEGPSNVSLYSSTDQREASYNALKPLQSEIEQAIGDKQVVIKINLTQTRPQNYKGATDTNFSRGILDFLSEFYDRPIIIGENSPNPMEGFTNYGYLDLPKEYNVKLADWNDEGTTRLWVEDAKFNPAPVQIINTYLEPNVYMISATRFKTHDSAIVTLSFKNTNMGAPPGRRGIDQKRQIHTGGGKRGKSLIYNMFRLATFGVHPDLAVLDGIRGMEGNGPNNGEVVEGKIAVASQDWVAADRIGVELMGHNYEDTKWLEFCHNAGMGNADIAKMNLIGPDYHDYIISYKHHDQFDEQREWIHEDFGI
ncbi:DUF362 domain-containing protein [Candidatus Latescibacterota bacterium]